ncbi:hypothetical protein ACQJBY_018399 [Aegilops geniculata]
MTSYRSCFHNFCDDRILQATPNLRTWIGFGLSELLLPKLRFLKVLHLEKSRIKNLMLIRECIHLRYLRLRDCHTVTLPSSIGQLHYLQTVDLRGTSLSRSLQIPVWAIPNLRHLYLDSGSCGTIERDPMPLLEKLPCLVVLHLWNYRGPTMRCSARGFPQLQNLELNFFKTEWTIEVGAMPRLSNLNLLRCRMNKLPQELLNLQCLKKLETNCTWLESDNTWKELEKKGCKVS